MTKSFLKMSMMGAAVAVALGAAPAEAGLLGAGRTVQAFYYDGAFANLEGEIPVGASTSEQHRSPLQWTISKARRTVLRSM